MDLRYDDKIDKQKASFNWAEVENELWVNVKDDFGSFRNVWELFCGKEQWLFFDWVGGIQKISSFVNFFRFDTDSNASCVCD